MQRDMDLIREILKRFEAQPSYGTPIDLNIQGYSNETVNYHLLLMGEAGLIIAHDMTGVVGGPEFIPERLTWEGHEFLDAARDDIRWNEAKSIMEKAGGFVYEVAKSLLIELMKNQIA